MKIPKINLLEIGALGLGGVGASMVVKKTPLAEQSAIVRGIVPIGIGVILSGMSGELVKNIGRGMIAGGSAALIQENIPGLSDDVLMNGVDNSNPYMAGSDSYDTTSASSGEMNF